MIMAERGWTQTELGRQLGRDQTWVSRAIAGHRDLRTREASKFLATVGWKLYISPESDGKETEDDPVKRREFVAGLASITLIPTPRTTPFHDPSYVNLLTQEIFQTHNQIGGDSLAARVLGFAHKVGRASAGGGRELQSAASDFMRNGAYVLRQAGRPDMAIRLANDAIRYAGQTSDADRQAWAYSALIWASSFNASSSSEVGKNGIQAVRLAKEALKINGIGDEPRAYLNACLACGLANVPGNERQAQIAIEKALTVDRLSPIDQADIMGMVGSAFHDMGKRQEAFAMFDHAVHRSSNVGPFIQGSYLCNKINIAFAAREPERAAILIYDLSRIIPLVDSARIDSKIKEILQAAKPWEASVPEVRQAREMLLSMRTTTG